MHITFQNGGHGENIGNFVCNQSCAHFWWPQNSFVVGSGGLQEGINFVDTIKIVFVFVFVFFIFCFVLGGGRSLSQVKPNQLTIYINTNKNQQLFRIMESLSYT